MKRVASENMYSWSAFDEKRQIDFNGHLWVRDEGNVIIDPVPMIDSDLQQLDDLGGAAWIVLTNRDHERQAGAMRSRTGGRVVAHEHDGPLFEIPPDRTLTDGEEIVPGLRAIHLSSGKSPGEIALYWPETKLLLSGDLIVGEPLGQLSLLADEKLADPPAAALGIRKLLALDFDAILVGDGHSIVNDARQRLVECLERRTDIYINKIDVDDVEWDSREEAPSGYRWESKELDALTGARHLGYRLIRLPAAASTFPSHFHHRGEELFVILEGSCTLCTPRGQHQVSAGEYIAFPPGPAGTHKFTNEGAEPCIMLAVGNQLADDVCEYPDSDKVNVMALPGARIFRKGDAVGYWHGEGA